MAVLIIFLRFHRVIALLKGLSSTLDTGESPKKLYARKTFSNINHTYRYVFVELMLIFESFLNECCFKGSVQQKLRPMLLYIIQKLFTRRWSTERLNFIFLKDQFTIYIKPLQRCCPSPITFAGKYNSTS